MQTRFSTILLSILLPSAARLLFGFLDENAARPAAMAYAASGQTSGLARDPRRIILPDLLLKLDQFHTQRLGVRNAVSSTELFDRFLHKPKSGGGLYSAVPLAPKYRKSVLRRTLAFL